MRRRQQHFGADVLRAEVGIIAILLAVLRDHLFKDAVHLLVGGFVVCPRAHVDLGLGQRVGAIRRPARLGEGGGSGARRKYGKGKTYALSHLFVPLGARRSLPIYARV